MKRSGLFLLISFLIIFLAPLQAQIKLGVAKKTTEIKLDGNLDEWEGQAAISLITAEQAQGQTWGGPDDLSAKVYLQWDIEALYLAVEVRDDLHFQPYENSSAWQADSIQLAVDTLFDRKSGGYASDDYEYGLILHKNGPLIWCWQAAEGKKAGKIENVSLAAKRDDNEKLTNYEAKFPWSELVPALPGSDRKMGFTILVNDNDGKGRKGWMELTPGIGISKDPAKYAELLLLDAETQKEHQVTGYVYIPTPAIDDGELLTGQIFINSELELGERNLEIIVSDSTQRVVATIPVSARLAKGANKIALSWDPANLPIGDYQLAIKIDGKICGFNSAFSRLSYAHIEGELAIQEWKLQVLEDLIAQIDELDFDSSYQAATAQVVKRFIGYIRDDMKAHRFQRVDWNVEFVKKRLSEAIVEAKTILRFGASDKKITRYQTAPVSIENTSFVQAGRPVYFIGVGHFGQVRADVPELTKFGFNIIQIEQGPSGVVLPEGYNDEPIKSVLNVLQRAAENNVAVNLLLSPHYFPGWALSQTPELANEGMGFIKYNIDHPKAREVVERFLRRIIPQVANHPALHSYTLSNEPQYTGYSSYSCARFQDWLKQKHGTIALLNELWGTELTDWNQIQIPVDENNRAQHYDWETFNQERFFAFHQWMSKIIREYDQTTPIHAKVMANTFDSADNFNAGIDHAAFARLDKIAGNDCSVGYPGSDLYAQQWLKQAMYFDLQRSLSNAPIFNSENHIIRDNDPLYYPSEHIRTALWQGAIYGQGATTIWVWERNENDTSLINNILTRANCVEAAGQTALDLARLSPFVAKFAEEKRQIAFLYPHASLCEEEYLQTVRTAYEGIHFLDLGVDFVDDFAAQQGKLNQYRLLIVPAAKYISLATLEAVEAYARDGGTVIIIGDSLRYDEYGRPLSAFSEQRASEKGTAFGLGQVYLAPQDTAQSYAPIFDKIMIKAAIERPVRVVDQNDQPVWGVEMRAVKNGEQLLINIVNLSNNEQIVKLKTSRPIYKAKDLISGQLLAETITLAPLSPMLVLVNF